MLPGGWSALARLLSGEHQIRNIHNLPRLSVRKILAWADDSIERTGGWPKPGWGRSGRPSRGHLEAWTSRALAGRVGRTGLRGGSSLAPACSGPAAGRPERRPDLDPLGEGGKPSPGPTPIMRRGAWTVARADAGPIPEAPGETSRGAIGLVLGARPRGRVRRCQRSSAESAAFRNRSRLPLTEAGPGLWADAHTAARAVDRETELRARRRGVRRELGARWNEASCGSAGLAGESHRWPACSPGAQGYGDGEAYAAVPRVPDTYEIGRRTSPSPRRLADVSIRPQSQSRATIKARVDGRSTGARRSGGYSLARLLADRHGVRGYVTALPPLTGASPRPGPTPVTARTGG